MCMPYKKPQCPDTASTACWDTARPHAAQRGCAGIRARIPCDGDYDSLLMPGVPAGASRTVIVQEGSTVQDS